MLIYDKRVTGLVPGSSTHCHCKLNKIEWWMDSYVFFLATVGYDGKSSYCFPCAF